MSGKIAKIVLQAKSYLLEKTDPALLAFLLLVLNYRFSFKIAAIVGIYLYRPDFKLQRSGIFYFYISMIALGIFNIAFIHRDYSYNHILVVLSGCLLWLGCLLSHHQIRLAVEKAEPFKITNTLKILALVNFIASVFDILKVMFITHTINPYTQVSPPPYGVSSGDSVGGIFGQIHLVNTVVSCLLVVFFIYRRSFRYTLICLLPFLLTGSNLAALILAGLLLYILAIKKDRLLKYYAVFGILITVVFYARVTPSNQQYMVKTLGSIAKQFKKHDAQPAVNPAGGASVENAPAKKEPTKEELINLFAAYRQKLKPDVSGQMLKGHQQSVYTSVYQFEHAASEQALKYEDYVWHRKDSVKAAKQKNEFFDYGNLKKFDLESEAGKITSFRQTVAYLSSGPGNAIFGSGIGSFSSRLAFITSGIVEDSRVLGSIPKYETPEFRENHKAIFKYLMYLDDEKHSITNLPFSWYNGLLGEYGLAGFCIFVACYLGFFVKRFFSLSYGKLLLPAMLAFFLFDYWYERLSVVILFELIMLLDLKMKQTKTEQ